MKLCAVNLCAVKLCAVKAHLRNHFGSSSIGLSETHDNQKVNSPPPEKSAESEQQQEDQFTGYGLSDDMEPSESQQQPAAQAAPESQQQPASHSDRNSEVGADVEAH